MAVATTLDITNHASQSPIAQSHYSNQNASHSISPDRPISGQPINTSETATLNSATNHCPPGITSCPSAPHSTLHAPHQHPLRLSGWSAGRADERVGKSSHVTRRIVIAIFVIVVISHRRCHHPQPQPHQVQHKRKPNCPKSAHTRKTLDHLTMFPL